MDKTISTPKILPNNLKNIRLMRNLTLYEAAEGLGVHPFFLSSVENEKNNLSGKLTMAALNFYDVNFEQLYDVKKTLILDSVQETFDKVSVEIILSELEILSDSIRVEEKILEELLKKNIDAQIYSYDIVKKKKTFKHGTFLCKIDVDLIIQETIQKEFDINFFKNSNIELTEILLERGFPQTHKNIKLKKSKFKLYNDEIILDQEYKISVGNDYVVTNKIELNKMVAINNKEFASLDGKIKITKNKEGEIETVNFISLEESMNNLKFIEKYLEKNKNINIAKIPEYLGLSVPGYSNLVHGNQRISTKVMWRMVKLFEVPLELILNTKRYMEEMYELDLEKKQ